LQRPEIFNRHLQRRDGFNYLHGFPVDEQESCAEDFVAPYQLSKALLQRSDIESALQSVGGGDIVGGTIGLQLMKKPQPVLSKGRG